MAENPPNPPSPDPDPTRKSRRKKSPLDQAQLEAISKAESFCGVAKKSEYGPKLVEREIDATFLDQLQTDRVAARAGTGTAVGGTSAKEGASQDEDDAEAALVIALQEVQAAAKQKFSRTAPAMLIFSLGGVWPLLAMTWRGTIIGAPSNAPAAQHWRKFRRESLKVGSDDLWVRASCVFPHGGFGLRLRPARDI